MIFATKFKRKTVVFCGILGLVCFVCFDGGQAKGEVKSSPGDEGTVQSRVAQRKTKPITALRDVCLLYDIEDTRGYAAGFEEVTIAVSKLPVVVESEKKREIPFQEIARIELQASKRKHPTVDHWDVRFLNAVITLRNQETVRCEIGSYLPLRKSGNKPASEIYNTTNIRNIFLSGKMIDTGLAARVSLYDIQTIILEKPGDSMDSLGTIRITPRSKDQSK